MCQNKDKYVGWGEVSTHSLMRTQMSQEGLLLLPKISMLGSPSQGADGEGILLLSA